VVAAAGRALGVEALLRRGTGEADDDDRPDRTALRSDQLQRRFPDGRCEQALRLPVELLSSS
jgi:hypothetical protein